MITILNNSTHNNKETFTYITTAKNREWIETKKLNASQLLKKLDNPSVFGVMIVLNDRTYQFEVEHVTKDNLGLWLL